MAWLAFGYWRTHQAVDSMGRMDDPGSADKKDRFREVRFENTGDDEDAAYRQAMTWLELEGASSVTFEEV